MLFFRDIANVTMDLNDVEQIRFQALGGADNIVVNDLSGTDLPWRVAGRSCESTRRLGGDGQVDRVTVNGAAGNETINVFSNAGVIAVNGSSAP